MLMYSQLAVGISGTIFIRVPWGPAVESLLHPAALYQKTEKEIIPEEMLCACHLSRTVAAVCSNHFPHGITLACPLPSVFNPQRLKHMEIDKGIISGFCGE